MSKALEAQLRMARVKEQRPFAVNDSGLNEAWLTSQSQLMVISQQWAGTITAGPAAVFLRQGIVSRFVSLELLTRQYTGEVDILRFNAIVVSSDAFC